MTLDSLRLALLPLVFSTVMLAIAIGLTAVIYRVRAKERLVDLNALCSDTVEPLDKGRGIESDRLPTLFEPAFRVDGRRVATTNWGLFVSRSIASEHGGRLEIESTPGRGTTARVSLPLSA